MNIQNSKNYQCTNNECGNITFTTKYALDYHRRNLHQTVYKITFQNPTGNLIILF